SARPPEGVDELEPVDAPPGPATPIAPVTAAEVAHRVVQRLRHHLRPGRQALEQAVVPELPAFDQRRGQPADEVTRVLKDRVRQVDTSEDPPRVAADRAQ